MNRNEKEALVTSLSKVFETANIVIVSRNEGLNAAETTELRQKVRSAGASYKVAKNRLVARALPKTSYENIADLFQGPTAISWADEPVAVAKALTDFAKTNKKFVVVGGALGNQVLDENAIKALSELPSLEELRGKIAGLVASVPSKLARLAQAPAGQVARLVAMKPEGEEA
ncbi:50S ribosomal protein L10 [Acetobacteraceae bacterium]|nr:50S ribosomal protein L10 [Acetobacteraceae bacterium]